MKLAQKLTMFLVLGMCLVLLLDFWLGVRRELRLQAADMRHDQYVTGHALGAAFADLWRARGRAGALPLLMKANRASGGGDFRWIDLDAPIGTPLAPRLPPSVLESIRRGTEIQRSSTDAAGQAHYSTYVPVSVGGRIQGAIELSESLAENRRYVRATLLRRIMTLVALTGMSGLIAILLGTVFVGRPMRKLVDKTRRIAAGDLGEPLHLQQRDEIGELAREIDTMCEKLEGARVRIAAETTARLEAVERMRHADRLATVGKLASGVAHELGTPLNVASQRAKMIATGEVSGKEAAEGARIIAEQTRRMTAVIRQLLDFARRHTPNMAPHDLGRLAQQTVQFLAPLAERRGVGLRVIARQATHADVDAEQIQQVLTNLVVNGIQSMEHGGQVAIAIDTRVRRPPADHGGPEGRYACIEVIDQGPGIPLEDQGRVFEPFFTTKQPGEGTGLGLSVAYGIVRDHGGWMEMESAPGRGSSFSIHLPLEVSTRAANGSVSASQAPEGWNALSHAHSVTGSAG